ncbi:alpha/beta fold hydrolase [Homoserinimonas sp. OAct 916]|uniref:alpha/beta fold hydrolase n=1 Tax=Homoserinimonas sp. OAct 916 TaxID=2211450 RepID=UPI001E63636A|nr:alpha/beta hydrolase [Homoserinimonas sp. OAct 916]
MSSDDATQNATTRFLPTEEGRIAYDMTGAGPLVVLVPGMGDLRSSYRFLAPELVAAGYTVVTTDLRGHGESDATFGSYGDVETARDITALVESFHRPAFIIGNSMAAGSAVLVAAARPDLVAGLVLIGPFVRQPASSSALSRGFLRVLMATPWAATMWRTYLPKLYAGAKPVDFDSYRNLVVAGLRRPGYAKSFSLTTRTSHSDAEARLTLVTAPTLVVMGAQDPDFKNPRAEADWIGAALHAPVVMIDDAGHYPQSQQPRPTARAIIQFLSKVKNNG